MIIWALSLWFTASRWIDYVYTLDLDKPGDLGHEWEDRADDLVTVGVILSPFVAIIPELIFWVIIGGLYSVIH